MKALPLRHALRSTSGRATPRKTLPAIVGQYIPNPIAPHTIQHGLAFAVFDRLAYANPPGAKADPIQNRFDLFPWLPGE